MFKNITILFVILITNTIQSQMVISTDSGVNFQLPYMPSDNNDNNLEFKKIASKMYFSENFNKSQVDTISQIFFLRYNIYKDEMEFNKEEKIFYLQKANNRKIKFIDENEIYQVFNYSNKLMYFKLLTLKGDNILMAKHNVVYIEAKPATSSYDTGRPADFRKQDDTYYLKLKNNTIKEIPTRKKDFFKFFNEKESDIKNFIDENKLDFDKESDLIKIIDFYNTL